MRFFKNGTNAKINKEVEDTSLAIFVNIIMKKLGLIEATNAIRPKNLEDQFQLSEKKEQQ